MQRIRAYGRRAARRVAEIRAEEGLTYAALSRRLRGSMSELAIRRIERFQRRIDVDELFDLADAFGVTVDDIIGDFELDSDPFGYAEHKRIEALPEAERAARRAADAEEVKRDAESFRKVKAIMEDAANG